MYTMQYELTLPADYDMKVIRRRVEDRGHRTDDFPGLGFKAYLIRERGTAGSPVNQYAPFYLWHETAGMNRFLWGGGGFQGIVSDFGRPTVRHWTGVALQTGPSVAAVPRSATRHTEAIPGGADPAELVGLATEALPALASADGVHSVTLAVDPFHWQLVRLTLSTEAPGTDATGGDDRYEVLHLSTPELADLPTGRHW
ncbi:MAG TPA: DUF4865 family protein [Pseudonocardia sp.]|nr:DUF4865 family protein [Pseudonocardia sp.]